MALLPVKVGLLFRPTTRPSLYLYLSLRLLQFGAAALTLSYFCSLIGFHRSHYCSDRFYRDQCNRHQQDFARVPLLYIIFVTTYCFMILAAFGLSGRHLSSILPSSAINSEGSIRLKENGTDDASHDSSIVHDAAPVFNGLRQPLRSVLDSALLIDLTVFILLSCCLYEYWVSIMGPNHMHPGSGYTLPVCWLFEQSTRYTDGSYWKNLSVAKQRCMDNQISFYGTIGVVVFTLMLVVVDAIYLHQDWSKKALDDERVEAWEKRILVDTRD